MSSIKVHNANPNVSEMDIIDSLAEKRAIHSNEVSVIGGGKVYQYLISESGEALICIYVAYNDDGSVFEGDLTEEFDEENYRTLDTLDFLGIVQKILDY